MAESEDIYKDCPKCTVDLEQPKLNALFEKRSCSWAFLTWSAAADRVRGPCIAKDTHHRVSLKTSFFFSHKIQDNPQTFKQAKFTSRLHQQVITPHPLGASSRISSLVLSLSTSACLPHTSPKRVHLWGGRWHCIGWRLLSQQGPYKKARTLKESFPHSSNPPFAPPQIGRASCRERV